MKDNTCFTCGIIFFPRRRHAKTCSPRCRMKMMRAIKAEVRKVEALRRLKAAGWPIGEPAQS